MDIEFSERYSLTGCRAILVVSLMVALTQSYGCGNKSNTYLSVVKEDFRHFHRDLWQDNKELFGVTAKSPNDAAKTDSTLPESRGQKDFDAGGFPGRQKNLAILLVAGGASGYVRCAHDDEIENHFRNHHTFKRDFNIAIGAIPLTELSLTGAGYIFGVLGEDEKLRRVAHSMIEAQALNGIYTSLLKLAAQDRGPNGESLAWPSGHTSVSVTFATVMYEYYGPWVGLPLYGLSGLVMYERMETGEHWASDVIFGAAIGYTVGRTVAGKYKPEIFGMQLLPYVNPESGSMGVVLAKQF